MPTLSRGANAPAPGALVEVRISWSSPADAVSLDLSALRLGADRRVRSDADFVFFNQPTTPDGSVEHLGPLPGPTSGTAGEVVRIDLAAQPAEVETVVVAATIDTATPDLTFAGVSSLVVDVVALPSAGAGGIDSVRFEPSALATEKALVAVELYRRADAWKVRAVGQGYAEGLDGLARDHGVSVDDTPAPAAATVPAPAEPLPVDMRKRLDLRKRAVGVVLEKKGIAGERASVAVVLDASGSMLQLYKIGTVARAVERLAAVAARLDDDGELDAWAYATNPLPLPPLQVDAMEGWLLQNIRTKSASSGAGGAEETRRREERARAAGAPVPDFASLGGRNDEPKVMQLVREHYRGTRLPVLVVFLTDGGIYRNREIEQLLRDCSGEPIFWQFVGVGRARYGVLETLDTLSGRVVDNAGFFSVDGLDVLTDDELYDRLLAEFPDWLRAARAAGVVQ